jgi:hypothetical protein
MFSLQPKMLHLKSASAASISHSAKKLHDLECSQCYTINLEKKSFYPCKSKLENSVIRSASKNHMKYAPKKSRFGHGIINIIPHKQATLHEI